MLRILSLATGESLVAFSGTILFCHSRLRGNKSETGFLYLSGFPIPP
jgi:hypothetical protein